MVLASGCVKQLYDDQGLTPTDFSKLTGKKNADAYVSVFGQNSFQFPNCDGFTFDVHGMPNQLEWLPEHVLVFNDTVTRIKGDYNRINYKNAEIEGKTIEINFGEYGKHKLYVPVMLKARLSGMFRLSRENDINIDWIPDGNNPNDLLILTLQVVNPSKAVNGKTVVEKIPLGPGEVSSWGKLIKDDGSYTITKELIHKFPKASYEIDINLTRFNFEEFKVNGKKFQLRAASNQGGYLHFNP